jgi:glycosyltransferase involved in cell wall biosynthesis
MSATPIVSILLPCRNVVGTLDAALDSLAAQTYDDFEIVAVDDGSQDGTGELLDRWRRQEPRLRVVSGPPRGIVAALDIAAREARGSLLARMDADDVARPERLARQVEFLSAWPQLAGCGTRIRYFPRRLLRDGARRYERWINGVVEPEEIDRDMFVECPIPHPTLLVRHEAFEKAGGYREVGWPEDYDLVLRLWRDGQRLGKVAEVLLDWREAPNRLSRVDPRYEPDAFRRCKIHFLDRRVGGRPLVVWGAGPVGKAFARAWLDTGHTVAAFVDLDPRKIGQEIHGAPVVAPSDITRYREAYVVAAVGQPTAREEIRAALRAAGLAEPEDCCAVA